MLILYNPPSSGQKKPVLPMSLLALGALLEGRHEYVIVDGNLDPDPFGTIDRLVTEQGATLLAVTVMPGPQLENAYPLCLRLKAKHPQLAVVWGGYFPTQHYEACLGSKAIDWVLRGHNEHGFVALVEALQSGSDPRAIPGLAWRHPLQVRSNAMPPIPAPDELPDFPYHRVEMSRYIRPTFMGRRTLPHHSSYGCPFTCNFCAVVNMVNGRWVAQSAERAASTVGRLVRDFGADAVEMYDNNFFTHEARTREFSERIMGLGIGWWGEARIDTLLKYPLPTWAKMRSSGLRMVFLGAESGSEETLRAMNKGGTQTPDKAVELAARMREYDVVPEMSFVLGSPPDPEADVAATMELIRRVKRVHPGTEIILYLYTPVPLAGDLYDRAKASGFSFPETLDGWVSPNWREFSQRRSAHLPWVEDPIRRRLHDFQVVLNAYYPTQTDLGLGRGRRALLRAASALRYHLRVYRHPLELRVIHKLIPYQRPDTAGF